MEQKLTHWKELMDSPYLGAYCLQPGQEIVLTIAKVGKESVIGADGKKEDCLVIHFAERDVKPMIVNATNAKAISKVADSPRVEHWVGKKIQVYIEKVKAFGDIVEALRVRKFAPKDIEIKCTVCKRNITAANGMNPEQLAAYTKKKYGTSMCADCAKKSAQKSTEQPKEQPVTNEAVKNDESDG